MDFTEGNSRHFDWAMASISVAPVIPSLSSIPAQLLSSPPSSCGNWSWGNPPLGGCKPFLSWNISASFRLDKIRKDQTSMIMMIVAAVHWDFAARFFRSCIDQLMNWSTSPEIRASASCFPPLGVINGLKMSSRIIILPFWPPGNLVGKFDGLWTKSAPAR